MTVQDDLMNKPIGEVCCYYGGRGGGGKTLKPFTLLKDPMTTTKHDAALARPSRHTANSKMDRQIAAATSPLNNGLRSLSKEQIEWNAQVDAKKAAKKAPKVTDESTPVDPNAWAFKNGLESC